ncbi:SNF2 family N-terminal domain-containing protein [Dipodascopsis tothii]|uniref:SNF2 family N-terminal domain-containing protein n=1 Tax=Dipodascopsis tothii TaxID=44089 RepID=UPI0034CD8A05
MDADGGDGGRRIALMAYSITLKLDVVTLLRPSEPQTAAEVESALAAGPLDATVRLRAAEGVVTVLVDVAKTTTVVAFRPPAAVVADVDLYVRAQRSRKLTFDFSPLRFDVPRIRVDRSLATVTFAVSLPASAQPTFAAAAITVEPLYGQLIGRALAMPPAAVDALLPPKELAKARGMPVVSPVPPQRFYQSILAPNVSADSRGRRHQYPVPGLTARLLEYQRESVAWCLRIEGKTCSTDLSGVHDLPDADVVQPWDWAAVRDRRGRPLWHAPQLGLVCRDRQTLMRETATIVRAGGGKGLLAEEMGLGKTVEIAALMVLNPRPAADLDTPTVDGYSGDAVTRIRTTLIVTPSSIHRQWIEELERHAPSLSVYVYKGSNNVSKRITGKMLADYDVVLTTYAVITRELHYAIKPPERNLRTEKKYEVYRSPLVQVEFWRVVLDEVQLVESGVGNAALVARMIPRFHAWGVSGTPVRNDLSDLAGLLQFLRFVPFIEGHNSKIWDRLCADHAGFVDFFARCCLRHTKDMVKEDIDLPPQRRVVLAVPFTTVEENNYRHLFQEFLDDCGFNSDGGPTRGDWDPAIELPKMARWLGRLRQTCCHAQIGAGNRKALGGGPLRTVSDVLDAMYDSAQSALLTDERNFWVSKIQRAQLLEQDGQREASLTLWHECLAGIDATLAESRKQLAVELERAPAAPEKPTAPPGVPVGSAEETEYLDGLRRQAKEREDGHKAKVLQMRGRVRSWLELEHRCLFFIASINFQLEQKSLEDEFYGRAEAARRELLQDSEGRAQRLMDALASTAERQAFVEIPEITDVDEVEGTLESRAAVSRAHELGAMLNEQANVLDEWREKLIGLLGQRLVDRDAEPDGEEYGESLDAQEEAFSYQEAIRQAVADRNEAVNGVRNNLVVYDVGREDVLDKRTELAKELLEQRRSVKPPPALGSLKAAHDDLRRLATQLGYEVDDAADARSRRLQTELSLAATAADRLRATLAEQKKTVDALDKEVLMFRDVYNARIEYYKQLQQLSDGVAAFEPKEPDKFRKSAVAAEGRLAVRVERGYARLRYLDHLKSSTAAASGDIPESERMCVICQSPFEIGSLTVCGHQYCRECMMEWWKFHRSCPICKRNIKESEIYSISYKPSEITVKEERTQGPATAAGGAIYGGMSTTVLDTIRSIDLLGSYGSKIDMIVRHTLWLREQNPSVQIVLFSQWTEFLGLLAMALTRHSVRHASIDKNMDAFKSDSDIACFLLHAKSQSSGLTLVNATHVILCEPLFNTSLELQAISRVHRIGQTRPTTVWMYTISGTVEESVLALATRRRLQLLQGAADPAAPVSDDKLDQSNSLEMHRATGKLFGKKAEGEIVPLDDLWDLFFGGPKPDPDSVPLSGAAADEYRRGLAADAAEKRAA